MMKLLLAALVALSASACAPRHVKHVNRISLVASTALIACDWGQTHSSAAGGWMGVREANPVLGENPSTGELAMYMGGIMAVNIAAYLLIPEEYRSALPLAITAVQADSIRNNMGTTVRPLCGIR